MWWIDFSSLRRFRNSLTAKVLVRGAVVWILFRSDTLLNASLCVTVFYCTFMFLYNIVSGQLALLLLLNDAGVTAEVLRSNIDWMPFLQKVGHFGRNFQGEGDVPHQPFLQLMPYNLPLKVFTHKKLYSRLSLREITFRRQKRSILLLSPVSGLGATYTVRLKLIGKLVVDFLFVMIELFSLDAFVIVTVHAFDRRIDRRRDRWMDGRTDRRTFRLWLYRRSIPAAP